MTSQSNSARTALVVGATGITGLSLTSHLARNQWQVLGLARKPQASAGVTPIAADLQNPDSVRAALKDQKITDIFLNVWSRQANEAENVRVNGDMLRNLFWALPANIELQHIALVTGTKQYLGPFESYGQTSAETPFREDTPRLPGLNFYYTQEDIVVEEAAKRNATWNVHRPHTVIGYARGNAMNMGTTLAVYATLCRKTGEPFIFPGSHLQWNAITDVTDARILAQHLEWAALTPAAHNEAFNIVNGDTFRWRWLWPQIAAYFGIEPQGPPEAIAPLDDRMEKAAGLWKAIAAKHNLAEDNIDKLVSWWHTDGDLGRQLECVNDMTKSRLLGFTALQPTPQSFFDLFDELKKDRTIPA
ncbi:SDR family oxidoreductase [Terriglobus saanensis]|uniref:NAD-dependent epimerase/dehydratase n=1 Tax=Terriglobus saanensis (strain ATCC BAA-1853 / DSM 23119 / SP1PR4) TaxID=401053 RepID=E8V7F4_TERSS|nr:SDR family oxidoreductase [Terriglobus saanensis]ADV83928.1 NAD-dependent epimerase/dehydratase [Terriglobus saanensis SP1PR4]